MVLGYGVIFGVMMRFQMGDARREKGVPNLVIITVPQCLRPAMDNNLHGIPNFIMHYGRFVDGGIYNLVDE
jgi:hypothetical protein